MFNQNSIAQRIIRLIALEGTTTEQGVADKLGISIEEATEQLRMLVAIGHLTHSDKPAADNPETVAQLKNRIATLDRMLALSRSALVQANGLLQELVAKPEGPFAILVGNTISGEFDTEELARQKALDVALNSGKPRSVRIIQVVDTLNVTQVVETSWQSAADEMNKDAAKQANFDAVAAMCEGNCEGCPNNA